MLTRKQIEHQEQQLLTPYAAKSGHSSGRAYKEKEHDYRSCYQRDKGRIIYSTAFRRLEYKTQVFVNHEGDHYRTRLTHTLEVAQIAKSIARALRLNVELAEAIALAHDVGHTPFGHSGEDALGELMADHGGFEHNSQGLRVVDVLEQRYPDFPGLNLTHEVREGIIKHSTSFDKPPLYESLEAGGSPLLEIQLVDIADEIAYDNHDLDDGLSAGLLTDEQLKSLELWETISRAIKERYPKISRKVRRIQTIRHLINMQVTELIKNTEKMIKKHKIKSVSDVRKTKDRVVCFGAKLSERRKVLRKFLTKNLYQHYRVIRMADKAYRFIKDLFDEYANNPEQLPPEHAARLKKENKYRVVCDYIAGMTDRYALDEYGKFFDPHKKV